MPLFNFRHFSTDFRKISDFYLGNLRFLKPPAVRPPLVIKEIENREEVDSLNS